MCIPQAAAKKFGPRLISPHEINLAIRHTLCTDVLPASFEAFSSLIPSFLKQGCVIVPPPQTPLSLLDLRTLRADLFLPECDKWISHYDEEFAWQKWSSSNWLVVRASSASDSDDKTWQEQQCSIRPQQYVPSLVELAWVMVVVATVRGVRLFRDTRVRTSTRLDVDQHITIGRNDELGIEVVPINDSGRRMGIGVALAHCLPEVNSL